MTTPTKGRAPSRREGNGQLAAATEVSEALYGLARSTLDVHELIVKTMIDMWAPLYSPVIEALRLTRGAITADD